MREATFFVLGLLAGVLITTSLAAPRVGRILARTIASGGLAAGVGGLVWSMYALSQTGDMRPIGWVRFNISEPGEALGWSAGMLAAGVTVLTLSFLGRSSNSRAG